MRYGRDEIDAGRLLLNLFCPSEMTVRDWIVPRPDGIVPERPLLDRCTSLSHHRLHTMLLRKHSDYPWLGYKTYTKFCKLPMVVGIVDVNTFESKYK